MPGPPQDSAARSQESPVSLSVARALQDCGSGSFGFASVLNSENPPFASVTRILRRRLPVRWRCGGALALWGPQAGLGPAHTRRSSEAAVEPAPCETVEPDTHPTPAGEARGPWPLRAPAPQGAPARRCRLRGGGLSPARRPECGR